ncbi:MAG: PAS domain-containing protein [Bacteroidota bacterium]
MKNGLFTLFSKYPNGAITISFLVIISLLFIGQVSFMLSVFEKDDDSRIINLAGRQRTITQEIIKLAYQVERTGNEELLVTLKERMYRLDQVYKALQVGDENLQLPQNRFRDTQQLFTDISIPHNNMIQVLESAQSVEDVVAVIPVLEQYEQVYLDLMDAIVDAMAEESLSYSERIIRNLFIYAVVSITITLLIGLVVILPVLLRIREELTEEAKEKNRLSKLFESSFEESGIGMALATSDKKLFRVNPFLCKYLGYSERELLSMTFPEFTHPDDLDLDLQFFHELLEGKRANFEIEKRYITKQGEVVWGLLSVSLIKDENGAPEFVVGVIQDITELKTAYFELESRERKLHEAQDLAQIGDWEWQHKSNTVFWSDRVYQIFGQDPDGFYPTFENLVEAVHPEDREAFRKDVQRSLDEHVEHDLIHRIYTASGDLKYVRERGIPFYDEHGNPVRMAGTVQDVTREELAKCELSNLINLLDETQAQANVGSWELDIVNRIPFWSDEVYRIHEVEMGTTLSYDQAVSYYREDFRVSVSSSVEDALQKNTSFDFEAIIVTEKGNEKWVRATGYPVLEHGELVKLRGLFFDISSEREMLNQIELREQQLQQFVKQAPLAVAMFDTDMKYMAASETWVIENELMTRDFIGVSNYEIFPEIAENERWVDIHQRVLNGENISREKERFIWKDGKVQWNSWKLIPWYSTGEEVAGMIMYTSDITEQVEYQVRIENLNELLEFQVKERTEELEKVNKELESFSYSVSHDLRAPLRAIQGFANILEEDYLPNLDKEGARYLSIIKDSSVRMGLLIDDILAFSRLGRKALNKAPIDLDALFNTVIEEEKRQYQDQTISIKKEHLGTIIADLSMMRQVVQNLVSNALKYSSKNDVIEISIFKQQSNGSSVFSVSDNGVGFDMRYHDKIFGVFQRLHGDSEFEGTGVGLSLVKRIIEKHDGTIWAESELGKGTTVKFSITNNN